MKRVNIIGAGLAGLRAAMTLAERGVGSNLISSMPSERAQSVLAEGGINGALDLMGEGDSPAEHCADTLRGGCDLADPAAVAGLTERAPAILEELLALGVPFQREGGKMIQRSFGGQKKRRTAYAKSSTGKVVMTALIDGARRYEAAGLIRRLPHHTFLRLELDAGRCAGALLRDDYSNTLLRCPGPVILACGGLNGLLPGMTTGTTLNSGDAAAALFAQGVPFANLEFIQYHPTTVPVAGKRLLVSEAARGEGGRLYVERDGRPWYFMEELHPELGNLSPRDVISREMARLEGQAYLDLTGLPDSAWAERLPDLREELRRELGLDPKKTPIPVSPGVHFFMGGVLTDRAHGTELPGLYAAGECACQYHGANRLGGNSMLGALYGGEIAADSAAPEAVEAEPLGPVPEETARRFSAAPAFSNELGNMLRRGLDVLRTEAGLEEALEALDALRPATELEKDRRLLGRAMLLSAKNRRESRGAHTRLDYPERDDERFRKTTVARLAGDDVVVELQPLPERSAP